MSIVYPVQLVAVVGGSGAGKGWLVERLCRLLGEHACHLQLDDFYRDCSHLPPAERSELNFDVPGAIDWDWAERVLRACRAGEASHIPCYDFATHSRVSQGVRWRPRSIVLVDGLWLLRPAAIRRLFDFKVYLDTPAELRRTRRLARDVAQRGYSADLVDRQLRTAVLPMHERYVEPQKKHADLVLRQPFVAAELHALADRLWTMLEGAALSGRWEREQFRTGLVDLLSHHEYCN